MKYSALNIDFNVVRLDPLGSTSPPYEGIKFEYPLENARFLPLCTNLAPERLQINTGVLHIITSTAGELSGGTNINDLERPWTPKIGVFSEFFTISGCNTHFKRKLRRNRSTYMRKRVRTEPWRTLNKIEMFSEIYYCVVKKTARSYTNSSTLTI